MVKKRDCWLLDLWREKPDGLSVCEATVEVPWKRALWLLRNKKYQDDISPWGGIWCSGIREHSEVEEVITRFSRGFDRWVLKQEYVQGAFKTAVRRLERIYCNLQTAFPKGTVVKFNGTPCTLLQDTAYYSATFKARVRSEYVERVRMEVKKLELSKGDVVVVTGLMLSYEEIGNLESHLQDMGVGNVLLVLPKGSNISSVSEEAMERHGWVRKSEEPGCTPTP